MKLDLDKNKKVILFALIAVVLAYLDLAYVLRMQLGAINRVRPQIIKLKNDLKSLDRDLERMRSQEKQQGAPKQAMAGNAKKLVQESRLDALLEQISDTALRRNVNIVSMQKKPYKEEAVSSDKAKSAPAAKWTPYFINLNLSCAYNDLGKFINDLENFQDFIAVANMFVTPGKKDIYVQDVNLALKTYVIK
ncbi:MAG: type 4a pilus biogenesis protein PilO [Candidatus Omnitrophota bacterium]|nr:type 4a pilus biogenesis protein PilO [Candidatus Omnitrophota bacterium]